MRRIPYGSLLTVAFPIACLCAAAVLRLPARAAAAEPRATSVDYVIALLDAGVDQKEIVARIGDKNLTFRLTPGDVDRLRAAGAGDELIDAVRRQATAQENRDGEGPPEGTEQAPSRPTGDWGRPSRLGRGQVIPAPQDEDQEQNSDEGNDGGEYTYPRYHDDGYPVDGGFDFYYGYPYPFYYYPFGSYIYDSYPYYHHPYPRFQYRGVVRGGGTFRGAPRGGHLSMPGPGGGFRRLPRGSRH